jgi:hypothetical protein
MRYDRGDGHGRRREAASLTGMVALQCGTEWSFSLLHRGRASRCNTVLVQTLPAAKATTRAVPYLLVVGVERMLSVEK